MRKAILKEGGIQVEGAVMMPAYMKNDEQKAIFANAKVNDVLVFNPYTAWDGNAAELASLLKIDKGSWCRDEIKFQLPGRRNHPFRGR